MEIDITRPLTLAERTYLSIFDEYGINKQYLSTSLGITPQALTQWTRVPPERVTEVEAILNEIKPQSIAQRYRLMAKMLGHGELADT